MALFDVTELQYIKTGVEEKKIENETPAKNYSYDDLVHLDKQLELHESYDDFTKEKYSSGIVFYDFEIFKYDWLVVLLDPVYKEIKVICNDSVALKKYWLTHQNYTWVGYNNKRFDDVILKSIILNIENPYSIMKKIMADMRERDISKNMSKVKIKSYDLFNGRYSLKVLEGFMGNNIEESSIPFDIQRALTEDEINLTIKYCVHDVEQTLEVFRRKIDDYNAQINLIETFGLPEDSISRTKGQLTAQIVGCERQEHDDEFDIHFVPQLRLEKYAYVKEWFEEVAKNKSYSTPLEGEKYSHILKRGKQVKGNSLDSSVSFVTNVMGIPHTFGWGGVHAASTKPINKNGRIFHCDVTSFYPSMMIEYYLLTRNSKTPEKFKEVYDTRVALKKAGKKKEQAPYKIILNSQYGITKDVHSEAYDPVQANNICLNGQLLLLDLIEHLEVMGDRIELLQSNTDGLFIWIDNDPRSEKWMRHICQEWIDRTKMGLGFDEVGGVDTDGSPLQHCGMVQKDVNNYVALFAPKPEFVEEKKKFYDEIMSTQSCTKKEGHLCKNEEWVVTDEMNEKAKEHGGFIEIDDVGLILRPKLKPELKGKFVGELDDLNYDLPIVNKALVDYITKGTPVEDTINNCDTMREFQTIVRLSNKFKFAVYNGTRMNEKTFRVFASKDKFDGPIFKCKDEEGTRQKSENSPEHCFIVNGDVKGMKVTDKVDKKWYIQVAKERLEAFGFDLIKKKNSLF